MLWRAAVIYNEIVMHTMQLLNKCLKQDARNMYISFWRY